MWDILFGVVRGVIVAVVFILILCFAFMVCAPIIVLFYTTIKDFWF